MAYRQAIELRPDAAPAWKGLAELSAAPGGAAAALVEAHEKLVRREGRWLAGWLAFLGWAGTAGLG